MYLIIVDEISSCRLLIMLGDGLRRKVLGDEFSHCVDSMLVEEVFQTLISYNNNKN